MTGAKIKIINNQTGETRFYYDEAFGDIGEYLWTEGNFGCDCNRALFFARAKDEPDIEQCCGEVAFSVPFAILNDGSVILIDADKICPVCTPTEEIEWSDLQSDGVELCNKHRVTPEGELPLSGELKCPRT